MLSDAVTRVNEFLIDLKFKTVGLTSFRGISMSLPKVQSSPRHSCAVNRAAMLHTSLRRRGQSVEVIVTSLAVRHQMRRG